MSAWLPLAVLAALVCLAMLAGWDWQRRHRNAGIVDVIWAGSLGCGALLMAALEKGSAAPRILLAAAGGIWGLRLAAHLWLRVRRTHYQRTAEHWLQNQDRRRAAVLAELASAYGEHNATLWLQRWRMFWMACAETFGYARRQEWLVGHYRFTRNSR